MPTYITLYKWTEQGVKNVKQSPDRIEEHTKAAEAAGGKLHGVYVTMGEYDLVSVAEWPDDETAAAFSVTVASKGNAQTRTMRAFTPEEFRGILGRLP